MHALEPDEERVLREHVSGCRSCRAAVAEAELVAGALGEGVEQVDPPPRLRESILAEAARTPQIGVGNAAAEETERSDLAGERRRRPDPYPPRTAGVGAGAGTRTDGRGRRRPGARDTRGQRGPAGPARGTSRPGGRRLVVATLALVAVLVVAGVGGLAAYTVQLQQQRDAQIARTQALAEVLTRLDRPGTSHTTLSTSEGRPVGAVVADASGRLVVTAGLAANDRDTSIYVLWGVSPDAAPQPIGTFDIGSDAAGPGVQQLDPGEPGRPFLGYAISLEPGRVAPASPTTVVASGQTQT
nr:anti-sigma factor [Pseudonocardia sp. C8]